jgi:hypothetical protein
LLQLARLIPRLAGRWHQRQQQKPLLRPLLGQLHRRFEPRHLRQQLPRFRHLAEPAVPEPKAVVEVLAVPGQKVAQEAAARLAHRQPGQLHSRQEHERLGCSDSAGRSSEVLNSCRADPDRYTLAFVHTAIGSSFQAIFAKSQPAL